MICRYCNRKIKVVPGELSHCKECGLSFSNEQLVANSNDLITAINLEQDPSFYQYYSTKDYLTSKSIELKHLLGMARKEYRRLRQKIYSQNLSSDKIDQIAYKEVTAAITKIQNILIEREGYYPSKVFTSKIEKELEVINKFNKKIRRV